MSVVAPQVLWAHREQLAACRRAFLVPAKGRESPHSSPRCSFYLMVQLRIASCSVTPAIEAK
jgi:hypothetical protein